MWHIANILTASRILMVPFFILFFYLEWYFWSLFVFVVASSTDLVDGAIARYINKPSQLGAFLDPLADKLLMISTFSCLVTVNAIPVWFLVLVILRDIVIMGGIGTLRVLKIEVKYEPLWSSKFTTLSQIGLGFFSLIALRWPAASLENYPISDFAEGLMYVSTVLIIITGLQYVRKGLEILEAHGIKPKRRSRKVTYD